jgi:hypothetical protein
MNYAVLILESTFHQQEFASRYDQTIAFIEVRRNNHIGDSSLVFHRDEDEPPWPYLAAAGQLRNLLSAQTARLGRVAVPPMTELLVPPIRGGGSA